MPCKLFRHFVFVGLRTLKESFLKGSELFHVYTKSFKCFRTTREKRSEAHRVRGQRPTSQTEGCIVDRKVKDTCGFQHVSVDQTLVTLRSLQPVFHIDAGFLFIMFTPKNKHTPHCVHTRQMRPIRDWVTGLWPISEDFSRKKKYSLSSFLSALSGMRCTWMKVGSVGGRGGEMFRQRTNLGKHLAEISYKLSAFPVYHLLRDSKHMQTPESFHFRYTLRSYIIEKSCRKAS